MRFIRQPDPPKVAEAPVNAELARSSIDNPPPDWQQLRSRWEYGHLAIFGFSLVGFGALVMSVVADTPTVNKSDRQ